MNHFTAIDYIVIGSVFLFAFLMGRWRWIGMRNDERKNNPPQKIKPIEQVQKILDAQKKPKITPLASMTRAQRRRTLQFAKRDEKKSSAMRKEKQGFIDAKEFFDKNSDLSKKFFDGK